MLYIDTCVLLAEGVIFQSGTLKVLGLVLEDGDFVNQLTQRDRRLNVLDRFWLDRADLGNTMMMRELEYARN